MLGLSLASLGVIGALATGGLLAGDAVAVSGTDLAATDATSSVPVIGHVRVAIASGPELSNYKWTAEHDQVVILQPWETGELRRLKRVNPSVVVLMYKNASAASSSVGPDGRYASGVSYKTARAEHWLLKNRRGKPFTFIGYSWLWAANIGSRSYQRTWVANVLQDMGTDPWNGVLLDDVNPTILGHYCVPCVANYPSNRRYQRAMQSFLQHVGPALQARGKLAIANLGAWSSHVSVVDSWLPYLSGGIDEQFVKVGDEANSGYRSPLMWARQLGEIETAESQGKLFIGLAHSSDSDEHAAVYGYATELLAANGYALYSMSADYRTETWFPEYGYAIGSPTGPFSVAANGVYRRTFTHGLVLVNPTTVQRTADLGGTYSGSGLTNAGTVTMSPQSGLVLVPSKAPPSSLLPPLGP
jgi:Hypothetical glycosyl hydrolase family 15